MELWKPIIGYEGKYEISSCGNVRSLNYKGTGLCKLLGLKKTNRGYFHVLLYKNKKCKSFLVHRLVADAFLIKQPNMDTVNHIDENPLNNNVNNLEWCTLKDNITKYRENHAFEPFKGGRHIIKGKVIQMDKSMIEIRTWHSVNEVCKVLHFKSSSLLDCCRGKRRSAYGYIWQFAK